MQSATPAASAEEEATPTESATEEGEQEPQPSEGEGEGESEPGPAGGGTAVPGLLAIALPGSTLPLDYLDVREDRVVLYGSVGKGMSTFLYKIKATNSGKVVVPAIHAESMYDRAVRARGEPGSLTVTRP
jgi:hypothetical protein